MNLATGFDLFGSLGASGGGFSGEGGERGAKGVLWGDCAPPLPRWVRSLFSVLISVSLSEHRSHYKATCHEVLKGRDHGLAISAVLSTHSFFIHSFNEMQGPPTKLQALGYNVEF